MADGDKKAGFPVCKTITTSDATVTELMTYALLPDHSALIRVEVVAQRYDGGALAEAYSYTCDYLFNKQGAAAATLRESGTPEELDPATTGWAVTVDADGNNARVQVTGTAAEDVRWMGTIMVVDVEQDTTV